jgi:two-component system, response regulator PdtaR
MFLPLSRARPGVEQAAAARVPTGSKPTPLTGMDRPTILLASDEPHRTIYTMLFQDAGYRVLEVRTAEEVVPLARREQPAAVVLDLAGRASDGLRAAERIRMRTENDEVGIVLLQPTGGPEIPVELEDDRTAVLRKPCGPRRVLSEVQRMAELAGEEENAARPSPGPAPELGGMEAPGSPA